MAAGPHRPRIVDPRRPKFARNWGEQRFAECTEALRSGKTVTDIAARFGIPTTRMSGFYAYANKVRRSARLHHYAYVRQVMLSGATAMTPKFLKALDMTASDASDEALPREQRQTAMTLLNAFLNVLVRSMRVDVGDAHASARRRAVQPLDLNPSQAAETIRMLYDSQIVGGNGGGNGNGVRRIGTG